MVQGVQKTVTGLFCIAFRQAACMSCVSGGACCAVGMTTCTPGREPRPFAARVGWIAGIANTVV